MGKKYADVARKYSLTPCQLALAWALSRNFNHSVIIGATSVKQLKENILAATITLSQEVLDDVDELHRQQPNPNVRES
eukprot:scaffold647_cov411-Prasinococcus_capsulatus_cf.AAC.3